MGGDGSTSAELWNLRSNILKTIEMPSDLLSSNIVNPILVASQNSVLLTNAEVDGGSLENLYQYHSETGWSNLGALPSSWKTLDENGVLVLSDTALGFNNLNCFSY